MTGFKSKKTLSDRMADAEKEGLRTQNEWQLNRNKRENEMQDLDFKWIGEDGLMCVFHATKPKVSVCLISGNDYSKFISCDEDKLDRMIRDLQDAKKSLRERTYG